MATRNAVYAKFGVTAEAAQLFETDLGTIILALEGEVRQWHVSPDPNAAAAFYDRLNSKTLGQLLGTLKQYANLEGVEEVFTSGLLARNRLNHGFFESHNYAIDKPKGRDAIIADLETLHNQLFAAWQLASHVSRFLVDRLISARNHQIS